MCLSFAAIINPSVSNFSVILFNHQLVFTMSISAFLYFVRIIDVGFFLPWRFLIELCFYFFMIFFLPLLIYLLWLFLSVWDRVYSFPCDVEFISFRVRSSWLVNSLLSLQINFFFFTSRVVVLLVNSSVLSLFHHFLSWCRDVLHLHLSDAFCYWLLVSLI